MFAYITRRLLATIPLLLVGVLVRALRDRPGRFQGIAHDVIGWLADHGASFSPYDASTAA